MLGFVLMTQKPSRGSSECKKWTSRFAGSLGLSITCAIAVAAMSTGVIV
jgi:hypothetical protein